MPQAQREWYEKDYYKVLAVPDSATEKEITRAYRKLAKQHHPDANPGSEERFKEISAAYDVLGDAAKRNEYDEIRRLGPLGAFRGNGAPFNVRIDDLGDLFNGIFQRVRGTGGRSSSSGPQRGQDVEASLHLSFLDAVSGITTTVNLVSDAVCSACHGSGSAPGTSPVICPRCGGRGVLDEDQGLFSFSQPCRDCSGSGMKIEDPCPRCSGSGIERRPRQVKVRIPAGVDDAQRIRVKGRGAAGRNGGPAGDLYVVVHVDRHPVFGRSGRNLTVAVPVTYSEATLGAEIKVPTLREPITLKVPAGTPSGRTLRVRGKGIPAAGGAGDLLVTVEVAVPSNLSEQERAAVESLKQATTESPRKHLGVE